MRQFLEEHEALIWALTGASVLVFVASLVLVPIVVARIPADYFAHRRRPRPPWADEHAAIRYAILIAKNTLGVILILGGLAMLFLPGQGLLTLIVGALLLDLPGKYAVEKRLVARGAVHRPLNWLRRRRGVEELRFDTRHTD